MGRVPMGQCLSNRGADVLTGQGLKRSEENSGVQKKEERRGRCGEIRTGIACGDGPSRKRGGLAESGRVLTSRSDTIGLSQAEAFGNSLADSVSFRFPSWLSLDGAPLLRRSCSALCQARRGGKGMMCSRNEWPQKGRGSRQTVVGRFVVLRNE